jgi:hypothetical protein
MITGQLAVASGQALRVTIGARGGDSTSGATTVALAECRDCGGLRVLIAAAATGGGPSGSSFSPRLRYGTISPGRTRDSNGEVLITCLGCAPRTAGRACATVSSPHDLLPRSHRGADPVESTRPAQPGPDTSAVDVGVANETRGARIYSRLARSW